MSSGEDPLKILSYACEMSDVFIIGVPTSDSGDLSQLSQQIGASQDLLEQRYFDGSTFVEFIVPVVLSGAAWATLRTWILARADIRKATRVTLRGIELTGMNAKEAARIISMLSENLTIDDANE